MAAIAYRHPKPGHGALWRIKPKEMPTSPTVELAGDVFIAEIGGVNVSDGSLTVTIHDGQDTPIYIADALSIPAGGQFSLTSEVGHWMPGGITWAASGSGIHVHATGWR